MTRIPIDLNSVRAARELRSGSRRDEVQSAFGLNELGMKKVESAYGDVPIPLIKVIERLVDDRDKLRKVIANLINRNGVNA